MRALDGAQLKEASTLTPGVGNLAVAANAPHPNATKLYLNYLLSREGQVAWTQVTGYPSLRQDVPTDNLLSFYVPKPGVPYFASYSDKLLPASDELAAFLRTAISR
jgi:ABC-type Fe3+ transport system substrate-binding protein